MTHFLTKSELGAIYSRRMAMGGFITYASDTSKPYLTAAFDDSERLQKQVEDLQAELDSIRNASVKPEHNPRPFLVNLPTEKADGIRLIIDRLAFEKQTLLGELIEISEALDEHHYGFLDTRVGAVKKLLDFRRNRLDAERQARIDALPR